MRHVIPFLENKPYEFKAEFMKVAKRRKYFKNECICKYGDPSRHF
jgi:hypothetical protein